MKRVFNKKDDQISWQTSHEYEKAIFVMGIVWAAIALMSFFTGFIQGLTA